MGRIRSIHPGVFTDEAFMAASPYARLLVIGLWIESWDDGVFEWKPMRLKARIFPVDNVDVEGLLAELQRLNFVKRFQFEGRELGAVRNFRRFQRPKKPNSSGVLPPEFRTFVGLNPTGSELVGNSEPLNDAKFGTGGEMSPQKGGREERKKKDNPSIVEENSSDTLVVEAARDPVACYSPGELATIKLEFSVVDLESRIRSYWLWCEKRGITKIEDRKSAFWSTLKNERGAVVLNEAHASPSEIQPSASLLNSRLTRRDGLNGRAHVESRQKAQAGLTPQGRPH
jgi:hypothetical protein